jgi:importin-5
MPCLHSQKHLPQHLRALASVLLRRCLLQAEPTLWEQLSEDAQSSVRSALLALLPAEQDAALRRRLVDTAGELAAALLEDGGEVSSLS